MLAMGLWRRSWVCPVMDMNSSSWLQLIHYMAQLNSLVMLAVPPGKCVLERAKHFMVEVHVFPVLRTPELDAVLQVQDLALALIEFREVHMDSLLELFQVPLDGILSFRSVSHATQLGGVCSLDQGSVRPAVASSFCMQTETSEKLSKSELK
ncbi:hypothetical protein BTVI_95024 [Pitangus sulphuratus]|nr:hypothetical protein BTVI_95024 [Pitangus sulphuratus]